MIIPIVLIGAAFWSFLAGAVTAAVTGTTSYNVGFVVGFLLVLAALAFVVMTTPREAGDE